jgi:hypothetical protein
MRKPLWLLPGAAIAWSGSAVAPPPVAHAEQQVFCNKVHQPLVACPNFDLGDWDRVRARYPGQQAHGIWACVYMYNTRTGRIRGGPIEGVNCGSTWSTPTWNPMGWNYGDTYENDYLSYIYLNEAAGSPPHTLVGWTSDNQAEAATADYK